MVQWLLHHHGRKDRGAGGDGSRAEEGPAAARLGGREEGELDVDVGVELDLVRELHLPLVRHRDEQVLL